MEPSCNSSTQRPRRCGALAPYLLSSVRRSPHAMTNKVSKRRRRALSLSMPVTSSDPINQLTQVIEIFHLVDRALTTTVLGREEMINLGELITQISGALLTLTDDLRSAFTEYYDGDASPAWVLSVLRCGRASVQADAPRPASRAATEPGSRRRPARMSAATDG